MIPVFYKNFNYKELILVRISFSFGNLCSISNLSKIIESSTSTLKIPPEPLFNFILTFSKLPFNSSSNLEASGK